MKVVLASASPRRKILLEQLQYVVETQPIIGIDETPPLHLEVCQQVEMICQRKAQGYTILGDEIVIVADTMIEHPHDSTKSIGKPKGRSDAKEILSLLSGQSHTVWTTTGVLTQGRWHIFTNQARVHISHLNEEEMLYLLDSLSWEGKAGAYDMHGEMHKYASLEQGEETTVLGLASDAIRFLQSIDEGVN
jgi:septum formation protein